MATRRQVEVARVEALSPSVRSVQLRCCDGQPFEFLAGQWVDLFVDTPDGPQKRAYSIASHPQGSALLELAVTRVEGGAVSTAIHALEPGDKLEIDGPHGFFTREQEGPAGALFVGTGTGLAPLRSMLLDALAAGSGPALPPMTLLFGCRSESDILWREELAQLQATGHVDVHVTLSRPPPGWQGRSGYVQTHLASLIDTDARPHVYICGLSRMVSEVRRVLKHELGFDRRAIHSERYD